MGKSFPWSFGSERGRDGQNVEVLNACVVSYMKLCCYVKKRNPAWSRVCIVGSMHICLMPYCDCRVMVVVVMPLHEVGDGPMEGNCVFDMGLVGSRILCLKAEKELNID